MDEGVEFQRNFEKQMQDSMLQMLTEENKEVLEKYTRLSNEGYPCGLHYDSQTNKFKIVDVISNG